MTIFLFNTKILHSYSKRKNLKRMLFQVQESDKFVQAELSIQLIYLCYDLFECINAKVMSGNLNPDIYTIDIYPEPVPSIVVCSPLKCDSKDF
jgi:hypothetical protein